MFPRKNAKLDKKMLKKMKNDKTWKNMKKHEKMPSVNSEPIHTSQQTHPHNLIHRFQDHSISQIHNHQHN